MPTRYNNAYHYLGLNYRQQAAYKRQIRERDNYTCQACGTIGYDVSHIIPFEVSHDSSPANLRVLCHSCNLRETRDRRLPPGQLPTVPMEQYEAYLRAELARITTER